MLQTLPLARVPQRCRLADRTGQNDFAEPIARGLAAGPHGVFQASSSVTFVPMDLVLRDGFTISFPGGLKIVSS